MDGSISDLTLTLVVAGAGCQVTIEDGAGACLATETVPPLDAEQLERSCLEPLRCFLERPMAPDLLETLGAALSERLLPARVRERLSAELRRCAGSNTPVRLRLSISHPDLAGLPWEFLYLDADPSSPGEQGFLALRPGVHLVRQLAAPASLEPVPADPLRVLVAWADPRSANYPALPHLEDEVRSVLAALRAPECRRVTVEELPHATPAALQRFLEERPPHVLHFIGHGDERPTGGVLVLQGERPGAASILYADDLARWLASPSPPAGAGVRMVVLSACRTASPARGVAETLIASGVPAVVAMQLALRDASAGLFARAFYAALVEPCPVEEAMRHARQAVRGVGPDWGVPVLYLGVQDGNLFSAGDAALPAGPPTNLPYLRNPHFVGRDAALMELHRALASRGPPVALVGMAGSGKTQLAVEYGHTRMKEYPGGVFWFNARDSLRLLDEYAAAGRFFDVPESLSTRERAARVRDRLQQLPQPSLLIFDNVTGETELALPPGGLCRIMITTRERYLARPGFQAMEVLPLEDEAALDLLQTHRPVEGPEERAAAQVIAAMLGNLPLALALAAHQVERLGLSFESCRQRLAGNRMVVLEQARRRFTTATAHSGSIFDAIDLSHRSLGPPGPQVLATAACFAGRGISTSLLLQACEPLAPDEYEEALGDLVDCSLVTREKDGRLTLHELVRVYARERLGRAERHSAVGRTCAVLAAFLERANRAMDWRGARPEMAHCRAVAELARANDVQRELSPLLREMGWYLYHQGEYPAAVEHLEEALQGAAAPSGRLHPEVARLSGLLGVALQDAGDFTAALAAAREALAIGEQVLQPGSTEIANCYNDLGYVLKWQEHLDEALGCYRKAQEINKAAYGRRHAEVATCLNNVGTLHEAQGDLGTARACLEEALAIDQSVFGLGHPKAAIRLNNIGRVLGRQGAWEDALARHCAALEIYVATEGRRSLDVAMSLCYIGDALKALGRPGEARQHYEEALPVVEYFCGSDHRLTRRVRERRQLLKEETSGKSAN